jgi:hypothetical protein
MKYAAFLLTFLLAFPSFAARHWLYSARKQAWNTPDNKFRVNDWAWGDPLNEWKLVCTELKATPDEPYIRWVPASYDTTGMTEITQQDPGDDYSVDMLEDVTFTAGGSDLAQGSWAPRTRGDGRWKWLHLTDADADSQGLPHGMLMVPSAYDTTSYTADSEATSQWTVVDISGGQYNNRGKKNPQFPAGVNVTVAGWAGVREEPSSVTFQGSADGPDETDGSITWSHNVTSGTGLDMRVLTFSAASTAGDRNITSVTFNGDALAEQNSVSRNPKNSTLEVWFRKSPDVGNYSVVVNRGCSGTCFVFTATSMVYEGTHTTDPGQSDTGFGTGTQSSTSFVVEDDCATAEINAYWNTPNQTADDSQTAVRNFPDSGPGINVVWGYLTGLSSGTITQNWSWSGSEDWIMVGAEVQVGVAAGGLLFEANNLDGGLNRPQMTGGIP